jgi:hypothetical protein
VAHLARWLAPSEAWSMNEKCSFNKISTKCNQISEVTYDQMVGILRPSHQFIKKIRRENLLNGSRSCIHALCSSILIGVSMQKIVSTYNKALRSYNSHNLRAIQVLDSFMYWVKVPLTGQRWFVTNPCPTTARNKLGTIYPIT